MSVWKFSQKRREIPNPTPFPWYLLKKNHTLKYFTESPPSKKIQFSLWPTPPCWRLFSSKPVLADSDSFLIPVFMVSWREPFVMSGTSFLWAWCAYDDLTNDVKALRETQSTYLNDRNSPTDLSPFFVQHWTLEGRGSSFVTLALRHQYHWAYWAAKLCCHIAVCVAATYWLLFWLAAALCAWEIQWTERTVQKRFARRAKTAAMGLTRGHC